MSLPQVLCYRPHLPQAANREWSESSAQSKCFGGGLGHEQGGHDGSKPGLQKGVLDVEVFESLAVLQVLAVEDTAPTFDRRS